MKRLLTLLITVLMVLSMGVCSVSADGELVHGGIAESKADTTVTYTSKLYNGTAAAASAVMLVAVYDEVDGAKKLSDVDIFPLAEAVGVGETGELKGSMTVSGSQTSSAFIWDSTTSLKPIKAAADMTAPVVIVDAVTNSTVELSWTNAAAGSGVPILRHALAKTYEGANPVYEQMTDNSYKEVGIKHDTPISYQVIATDALGRQIRSAAADVRTDDIGRIYLGKLSEDGVTISTTTTLEGHNLSLVGTNQGGTNGNYVFNFGTSTADTVAKNTDFRIGLNAAGFASSTAAFYIGMDEEFAAKMNAEEDVKFIVNYYDGIADSNGPAWIRWPHATSSTTLDGQIIFGTTTSSENCWNTDVLSPITDGKLNRNTWDFKAVGSPKATLSLISDLYSSTLNNTDMIYMTKIEVAGADYVPYGAVLDFDKQEETQFVKFFRKAGINHHTIANKEGKVAMELPYDATATKNSLYLKFDEDYVGTEAADYILRVTYYDGGNIPENRFVIWYASGKQFMIPKSDGNNGWKTKDFDLTDYTFDNIAASYGAIRIYNSDSANQNPQYISRVEVIKK